MNSAQRNLKILHITEAACAGVGGHMLDLAEGLDQLGCENHLIYSEHRVDESFRGRAANFSKHRKMALAMRRMPHWSDVKAKTKIGRYIKEHGPFDIVHGHSTKAGGLTRLKGVARGAAVVYTPNGIFTMNPTNGRFVSAFARKVELWLAQKCAAIIAVSPEERNHMLSIGLPPNRIHFIPNGLRSIAWPNREQVRRNLGLAEHVLAIGFLGRFASQKNPLLMIEAFARIRSPNDRPLRLLMVGDGPLTAQTRELANKLRVADRIDWLGYRTAQETMPAFDIFTMPSRYEGMPYVLMEAVTNGIPVVATQVGGASLSVDHGRNGFLVPPENADDLATALQQLVDQPVLRADFAVACRKKSAEFAVDKMIARTFELYCEILGVPAVNLLSQRDSALSVG